MSTTTNGGVASSPYDIGKTAGVEGNYEPIANHRAALASLGEEFSKTSIAGFDAIKEHHLKLAESFDALRKAIEEQDKKYYNDAMMLMGHLKELLLMAEINHRDIPTIIQEFKERALRRFDDNNSIIAAAKANLEQKSDAFEVQSKALLEKIEKDHAVFLEQLKCKDVDFTDVEKGFFDGTILRIALTGK